MQYTAQEVFSQSVNQEASFEYSVSVMFLEVYQEALRDLLVAGDPAKGPVIREDPDEGIIVHNATVIPVSSAAEVVSAVSTGQAKRAVGETAANERSSRSHAILTLLVRGTGTTG